MQQNVYIEEIFHISAESPIISIYSNMQNKIKQNKSVLEFCMTAFAFVK